MNNAGFIFIEGGSEIDSSNWRHPEIVEIVRRSLAEDVGSGDVTTDTCVPADVIAKGVFLAREPMIVAGVDLLPILYDKEDIEIFNESGSCVSEGAAFVSVRGAARRLLTLERTALNFLQRLSGVAVMVSVASPYC